MGFFQKKSKTLLIVLPDQERIAMFATEKSSPTTPPRLTKDTKK